MRFLKLNMRSLAALPVFLVFMACDKLLPTSGSGVDIPVKIRAVNVAGGSQNETITRASGGEKRIVQEPVIQDLGDGMLAEITVEEDVSALRADPQRLDNGAKFRIVALKKNTSEIYSWADYTAAGSGTLDLVVGNLHVVSGIEYDFVCFSYNSTTANWPAALNEGDALGSITVTNADGFLYKRLPETSLSTTSNTLSITLAPQYVKVKLKLDVNTNATRTITSIAANSISINAPTSGSFNLASGVLSAGSNITKYFGWPTTLGTATAESEEFTFLPKAGDYTLSFAENAAKALENSTIQRSFGPGSVIIPNSQLKAGYSYTIGLKLYRVPRFAGSNIYWDGAQLTFDLHGNNANTKYQGVCFQWGSLIGISPVGDYDADNTVLYKPINTSDPVGTARTWTTTYGSEWGSSWDDIPYYTDGSTSNKSAKTLRDNSATANFNAYKGDICYYINKDYRMPTMTELDSLRSSSYVGFTNIPADVLGTSVDDVAGRYAFTANYGALTSHVLPASGGRNGNTGASGNMGDNGYYWSGSAGGSGNAYDLRFSKSGAGMGNDIRSFGRSVRCVKN